MFNDPLSILMNYPSFVLVMSNFKTVRCTGGKGVPGSRGVVGDELSFFTCEPNRLGTKIRMISEKEWRKNRKGWKWEKKERKKDLKNGKDEKMQKSINNNKHHRHGFLLARASTRFTFYAVPLIPLPRHQARSKGATTQPRHQTQDPWHGTCGTCGTCYQLAARMCGAQWLIQLPHPLLLHAPHTCCNATSAEGICVTSHFTSMSLLYVTEGPKEGKRFKHFTNFNRLTKTTPPGLMFLASSQILFLPF